MVTMKKAVFLPFCFLAMMLTAEAQPYSKGTFSFSAGGELLIPENSLNRSYQMGLGFTTKGEYVWAKHASATLTTGYYFMEGKKTDLVSFENVSAIPVKAGLRYYLGNFYGAGEAGGLFFLGNGQPASFVYSVGIGDKFLLKKRVFDVTVRHEGWRIDGASKGIIAIRIGYEFAVNDAPPLHQGF